jgi:hypothetical protein
VGGGPEERVWRYADFQNFPCTSKVKKGVDEGVL